MTFSYERKIDANKSLTLGGGFVGFSNSSGSYVNGKPGGLSLYPVVYGSYRNYYERKNIKKDNLRNNSGNYVGLFTSYRFKAIGTDNTPSSPWYTIGPVWGMQRNYASGIHLGLSLGPGIVKSKSRTGVTIVGHFELGFRLFAK